MPIQQKSLPESIKRAAIVVIIFFTMALAGCGGSALELEGREPAKRPTTPQQDILVGGITCTGIFPCRNQFASIVASKVASGSITLNHNQTYMIDTNDYNLAYGQVNHANEVIAVGIDFGSGARITLKDIAGSKAHNIFAGFSKQDPIILNISGFKTLGKGHIDYPLFSERNVIISQGAGNEGQDEPEMCFRESCWEEIEAISQTGRLIVVSTYTGSQSSPMPIRSHCGRTKEYCIRARGEWTSYSTMVVTGSLQLLSAMWPYLSQEELVQLVFALAEDQGVPGADKIWGRGSLSFRKLFTPNGVMGFKCSKVTCVDTHTHTRK